MTWRQFQRSNICVPGSGRTQGRQWGIKSIGRNNDGNFLNLVKDIHLQIQESEKTPSKTKTKNTTPKHIMVKLLNAKDKEKNLKRSLGSR